MVAPEIKVAAVPDLHWPYHDEAALRCALSVLRDFKPDKLILLGDLVDFRMISRFVANLPGAAEGERVKDDLDGANIALDLLSESVRTRGRSCAIDWIEGNHEFRLQKYVEAHPVLRGLVDNVHDYCRLHDRKVSWVRNWSKGEVVEQGHASFVHGLTVVQYHAAKSVRDWGSNVFYGHTHDVQEFPIRRRAKNTTIKGKSLGCLCRFDQDYMRNRPMNWQHALGLFYFWRSGKFQEYTVHIQDGECVGVGGRHHDGNNQGG